MQDFGDPTQEIGGEDAWEEDQEKALDTAGRERTVHPDWKRRVECSRKDVSKEETKDIAYFVCLKALMTI